MKFLAVQNLLIVAVLSCCRRRLRRATLFSVLFIEVPRGSTEGAVPERPRFQVARQGGKKKIKTDSNKPCCIR